MVEIRKQYDALPRRPQELGGETLTEQHHKDACDINNILSGYAGPLMNHVRQNGQYIDVPAVDDYHHAMNITLKAQQMFDDLPAAVRKEMDNDPAKFLDFVSNPENVERMGELGLLNEAPGAGTAPSAVDLPPPSEPSGDVEGGDGD